MGTGTGAAGVVIVPDVHPWAPGDGYLYDLEVQLVDPESGLVDSYHQSVGVRTVEVRGAEFLVNGAPFRFTGFGMHEDHPTLGKGHNDAFLVQDFALLGWIGANSFRTSHYPYSEDVLDLADRRGIVVIDETAAVGLNMGLGGGIFGAQGYQTFSDDTINEQTRAVHAQAIRELVARDKNHPSVVLWSIANEPESETAEAEDYFRPLFDVAHAADPTRPVGFVNVMLAPHGTCRVSTLSCPSCLPPDRSPIGKSRSRRGPDRGPRWRSCSANSLRRSEPTTWPACWRRHAWASCPWTGCWRPVARAVRWPRCGRRFNQAERPVCGRRGWHRPRTPSLAARPLATHPTRTDP